MSVTNWKTIGEAIGLLAIVASLIFVGFQMRQDRTIARSELASDGFDRMSEIAHILIETELATTYVKMLEEPDSLTTKDKLQLNAFYTQVSDFMARECYLVERGVYVECENALHDSIRRYFGNPYAKAWWQVANTSPNVDLPAWVHDEILNSSPDAELMRLESLQQEIVNRVE